MTDTLATGRLSTRTKLIYGVGDMGNAVVNSAVQFFLPLIFFALALPLLIWYPITRTSHAEMRRKLEAAADSIL